MSAKAALCWLVIAFTSIVQGPPSKPDFSGRWTLNIAGSEFPGARPSSATLSVVRTIEQKRNELRLKIERVSNGQKSELLLQGFLDGRLRQRGHDPVSGVVGMQAVGGEVFLQQAASVHQV